MFIISFYVCDGFSKNRAIKILGALSIVKEDGIRTYKDIDKSYYRINKGLQKVDFTDSFLYSKFKEVKSDIENMQSLSMTDYQGKM